MGEFTHLLCCAARTFTGLLSHRKNMLNALGHTVGQVGFLRCGVRNHPNQISQLARHAINFSQSRTCRVRQSGTFHHTLRGALHSGYRILGVSLNRLHQCRNLTRRVGRAFGQSLHFFRHHREASSGFTSRRGLNGCVQRQHVGLFGNVRDQFGNFANLLRGLTQTLDALGGVLNLIANGVHTADGVLHRLQTRVRSLQRLTRHLGRFLRLGRDVVDTARHVQNRLAGFTNFMQLLVRCGQQLGRCQIYLLCRLRHTRYRALYRSDQRTQLFHRVVHRVGNRAGNVFGHGGFLRQVTFGNRLQLIHQTQNSGLVGVVDALGFLLLQTRIHLVALGFLLACTAVEQLYAGQSHTAHHSHQNGQCQTNHLPHAGAAQTLQRCLQLFQLTTQWFAIAVDSRLRFTSRHQTLQIAQNGAGLRAGFVVLLDQCLQLLAYLRIARCGQAQFAAAVEQAFCNFLEGIQVLAQQEHGLRAHAIKRLKLVGRLADTLGQHHQLTSSSDFRRIRALLQLERGNSFSGFQEVRRLTVDRAQRPTHLGQCFLLTQNQARAFFCTLHHRADAADFWLQAIAERIHTQIRVPCCQGAHAASQHARAVLNVAEGRFGTRHGQRNRLGQSL